MCTEYLFNGEEVRTLRELTDRIDHCDIIHDDGTRLPDFNPDDPMRLEYCLCGWNVIQSALATGWHPTDPPEGDDWPYGGVFAREGG